MEQELVKVENSEMTATTEVNKEFNNFFPIDKKLDTISKLQFSEGEIKILYEPFDADDLDILPHNGVVYAPWIAYMKRMRAAFKGSWMLVPHGLPRIENNKMIWPYYLFVKGHLLTYSIGECNYVPSNKEMSYGDSAEGAKSNALMRCCKAIGVGVETWDRKFLDSWKNKNAHTEERMYKGNKVMHWFRNTDGKKHLYLRLLNYLFELLDMTEAGYMKKKGKVSLELCKEEQLKKYKEELEYVIKAKFYPKEVKKRILKSKIRNDMIIKINKLVKNRADLTVKLMEFNISDINKASDEELQKVLKNLSDKKEKPAKIEKKKPEKSLEDLMNQVEAIAKEKKLDTKTLNTLTEKICGKDINIINIKKLINHLNKIGVKK